MRAQSTPTPRPFPYQYAPLEGRLDWECHVPSQGSVRAHVPPKEVPGIKAQDKRPVADFVHDMHAETGLVDHTLWGYFIGKTVGKTETKETV